MDYKNLDIFIEEKTDTGYLLKAHAKGMGEFRSHLVLDPSSAELQKTLQLLSNHQVDRDAQIEFGIKLYSYIFKGEIARVFYELKGSIQDNKNIGMRIRLRIHPPELAVIPWELLCDPGTHQFLVTSEDYPLVRYIESTAPIENLRTKFPVRILVIIPEYPDSYSPIDATTEKNYLTESLKGLERNIIIKFIEGCVTRTRIIDEMRDVKFQILHFIGHGDFRNQVGTLLLNREDGDVDPIDDGQLVSLFQNQKSLKLVLLNSCKGATVSSTLPMVGIAPKLVASGIPAVIAMQYAIYDDSAVSFTREFYHKLFNGYDIGRVDVAICHARSVLGINEATQRDICTPVLFMRAPKGVLFDIETGNRLKNHILNKSAYSTIQALIGSYRHNLSTDKNPEDIEGLNRLQQRVKYSHYAIAAVITSVIFIFSLLWVSAFDLLTLDTRSEALTMWLGDQLVSKPVSDDFAMIGFSIESKEDGWKEHWRGQHASLINILSVAGASVIVFDIEFSSQTSVDNDLSNAINTAKRDHGTTTVLGYTRIKNNDLSQPLISEHLLSSEAVLGLVNIGQRLESARSAVLAINKSNKRDLTIQASYCNKREAQPQNAKEIPNDIECSMVLEAYSAFKGDTFQRIDTDSNQIILGKESISLSEYKPVRKLQHRQHWAILKGDYIAQIYFDFSPLELLRGTKHSYSYNEALHKFDQRELEEAFKDKIILVGEKNLQDQFDIQSSFGQKRFGYELHADALNALLNKRIIRANTMSMAFLLMMIAGGIGAFLRYYVHFHNVISRIALLALVCVIFFVITLEVYTELLIIINVIYHIFALLFAYWLTGKLIHRRRA